MPKLRIYKKRVSFAGPSDIFLYIDDVEIGKMKSDDKIETDVSFGLHTIQVKSRFFNSEKIQFKMDVKKEIEISVRFNLLFTINQILFTISVFMSILWNSKFLSTVSLIFGISFLLTLLIKRKDFFYIKELN